MIKPVQPLSTAKRKKENRLLSQTVLPYLLLKLLAHFHILDDFLNRAVKAEHARC